MNKQNFNQLGGFRLETDNLDWMQTAYDIFNALGYIAGDKTIISGCVVAGSTIGDGIVFVNGEVFKFVGGNIQATVRILETETTKVFENGDVNVVHKERYVTFATGVGAINWADFKRIDSLVNLQSRILPPGTNPQLYSGAIGSIPAGWQLCDGTNGTPNLKSRFIVGYDPADPDYNAIGKTGGEKKHQLSVGELPKHTPTGTTASAGTHTHTVPNVPVLTGASKPFDSNAGETPIGTATTSAAGAHTHALTMDEIGNNEAHENRPPYYVLAYIIYIG